MVRTLVYLTEEEKEALNAIATRLGRTQSDLIREAIERFLDHFQEGNRLELLRGARDIWKTRTGVRRHFDVLRRELDRRNRKSQ